MRGLQAINPLPVQGGGGGKGSSNWTFEPVGTDMKSWWCHPACWEMGGTCKGGARVGGEVYG